MTSASVSGPPTGGTSMLPPNPGRSIAPTSRSRPSGPKRWYQEMAELSEPPPWMSTTGRKLEPGPLAWSTWHHGLTRNRPTRIYLEQ